MEEVDTDNIYNTHKVYFDLRNSATAAYLAGHYETAVGLCDLIDNTCYRELLYHRIFLHQFTETQSINQHILDKLTSKGMTYTKLILRLAQSGHYDQAKFYLTQLSQRVDPCHYRSCTWQLECQLGVDYAKLK